MKFSLYNFHFLQGHTIHGLMLIPYRLISNLRNIYFS